LADDANLLAPFANYIVSDATLLAGLANYLAQAANWLETPVFQRFFRFPKKISKKFEKN